MQHIRTPAADVSHLRSIFDLIAAIVSHGGVSLELLILEGDPRVRDSFSQILNRLVVDKTLQDALQSYPIHDLRGRAEGVYTYICRNTNG